jgi:hypothetical protein
LFDEPTRFLLGEERWRFILLFISTAAIICKSSNRL